MRSGRHATLIGIAIGLGLVIGATAARAGDPCVGDAKLAFLDCKGDCKEGYQIAKDACRNNDHVCMEGCRARRAQCILDTSLDEDLLACRNTLRRAKDKCREDHADDPDGIDGCIDQVQVVAFLCRRDARIAAKPDLAACRLAFRVCAQECPPNPDSTMNIDKVQCIIDAKNAYLACKADCRERFQEQKDLCLNRDHACLEVCRAQRDTCRAPIEDQLDADIASCNATKTGDVTNCENTYPPGENRERCITQALVDAFQCRDGARERARPGFEGCRAAFQTCAEDCPPA